MKVLNRLEELKGKLELLEPGGLEIKDLEDEIEEIKYELMYGVEASALDELRELFLEMHGKSIHLHSEDYTMEKMRIIFRDIF